MKTRQMKNAGILLLTAIIWGFAFVAQSVGMDYVGPFTFNCVRFFIGALVLIPCIALLDKLNGAADTGTQGEKKHKTGREEWIGGICCGIALATASCLQQIGIMHTTVGKAGFITACYILLVPIFGLFFHKKCGILVWIGVILAVIGLYFLCINENLTIGRGDIMVFLCAIVFAIHILAIDHFSPKTDGVRMSCIQFFVSGVLCLVPTLILEHPHLGQLLAAWQPILYAGVLSCGVAYTLQIIGQKGMNPTVASLILSLESVMSVLAGILVLGEMPTAREVLGCVCWRSFRLLGRRSRPVREQTDKFQSVILMFTACSYHQDCFTGCPAIISVERGI